MKSADNADVGAVGSADVTQGHTSTKSLTACSSLGKRGDKRQIACEQEASAYLLPTSCLNSLPWDDYPCQFPLLHFAVLGWVPPEASRETRVWVQLVDLGRGLGKHG